MEHDSPSLKGGLRMVTFFQSIWYGNWEVGDRITLEWRNLTKTLPQPGDHS